MSISQVPSESVQDPNSWLQLKLQLRPELRVDHRNGESQIVIIEDPTRGRFYQLGVDEFELVTFLDGTCTIEEAIQLANQRQDRVEFNQESAKSICDFLLQSSLARFDSPQQLERIEKSAENLRRTKWMSWTNPICLRVDLFNPDRLIKAISGMVLWCFSSWMFVLFCLVGCVAIWTAYSRWDLLISQTQGILSPDRWYWLIVSWVLLKVIHELAHGLVCHKYGGSVRRGGIFFILFAPLAYVDVTSAWRFSKRSHRIYVSAAGIYAELWVAFVALIAWSYLPTGFTSDICYQLVLMASLTTIAFNANPLMRFDGYFILSDWIKINNLYQKGQAWVARSFKTICLGLPSQVTWSPSETKVVALYGILAFLWRIFLCTTILLAASILWNGFGLVFALIGGISWICLPLYRFFKSTKLQCQQTPFSRARCVLSLACTACLIIAAIMLFRSPASLSAPALVQFEDEKVVRSAVEGFVEHVVVRNGDFVTTNQPLFKLKNELLDHEIRNLQTKLKQSAIQARVYQRKSDIASYQAELKLQSSLKEQLAEKTDQVNKLVIRAPSAGYVHRRGLENMIGSWLSEGDTVVTISNQDDKKVTVSISQNDLESLDESVGEPVRLLFPGVETIRGTITEISPRATDRLVHESLCVHAGGPLPVREFSSNDKNKRESEEYRLLTPRFYATVQLDDSSQSILESGQRGNAMIKAQQTSLASYAYLKVKRWLTSQIDTK